jgi:predicted DCC family thiol-disulfide oxidoreductase YuxK
MNLGREFAGGASVSEVVFPVRSLLVDDSLLIYDGDCGFCTRSARWIEDRWPANVAVARSFQELGEENLARYGLSLELASRQVWWVDEGGLVGGECAVAAALEASTGWSRRLGIVLGVPFVRVVSAPSYRIVARFRHRLPGATDACRRAGP